MNDYITKIDNWIRPLAEQHEVRVARVGGSVRDEILGRKCKDADYVVFGLSLERLGWVLKNCLPWCEAQLSPLKLRDGRQAGWRLFKPGYGLVEIMLPRTERPWATSGRGGKHTHFDIVLDPTLTPEEDARRRDFTFNALYKWLSPEIRTLEVFKKPYGVLENVTDPTGRGLYDLQHKLINTTHSDSFRDDPLRILRALRFVSTLGYDLGSNTLDEMRDHAEAAHGLSAVYKHQPKMDSDNLRAGEVRTEAASGTVLTEMSKLLMGDDVGKALRIMRDTGVLAVLFPEWASLIGHEAGSRYHDLPTDEHTFVALEAAAKADAPLVVRWALFWHDAGKPETEWVGRDGRKHYYEPSDNLWYELCLADGLIHQSATSAPNKPQDHEVASERIWRQVCKRLNVPKDLREGAALLIRNHMVPLQPRNAGVKVRRWRVAYGDEMLSNLLLHRACDCMGKQKSASAQLQLVGKLVTAQERAIEQNIPASVKDLNVDGKYIKEVVLDGLVVNGRLIGQTLDAVLDEVVCQPDEQRLRKDWQRNAAYRHMRHLIKESNAK